jgi:hypothetical protein
VNKRLPVSALLGQRIEELLSEGIGGSEELASLARLGAQLVIQRADHQEVQHWGEVYAPLR